MKVTRGDMAGAHAALDKALTAIDQHKDELPPGRAAKGMATLNDIMTAFEHNDAALKARLAAQVLDDAKSGQAAATMSIEALAGLGRPDLAFQAAEELYLRDGFRAAAPQDDTEVPLQFALHRVPPNFLLGAATVSMLRDVRIWRIFAAVGVAKYWLDSGQWPDFCATPDLGYDCKAEARKAQDAQRTN